MTEIIAELESGEHGDLLPTARERLERYESGEVVRSPWR
jgi:hypothetical protein